MAEQLFFAAAGQLLASVSTELDGAGDSALASGVEIWFSLLVKTASLFKCLMLKNDRFIGIGY
ncbi:hypothetical protein D5E69_20300 [Rossellomorea marisflavi]|uniref:hypothetical protein n=1 Tax=Rossellomorea marisflavi TaxID=189381 RepID=UPI00131909B8|nr:hypothetical protein [Rossellomorea marisflavi]QHA37884.1 hypothetical protein D5E69_20300 [Rossellomorea marisflavi]